MLRTSLVLLLLAGSFSSIFKLPGQDGTSAHPAEVRRVTLTCDETCSPEERSQLPEVEALVQKIENSDCFAKFFANQQGNIHESQSKTPEQIVNALRAQTATIRLTMYNLPFVHYFRFWNIPCGNDNDTGASIEITHACWRTYSPVRRAGTVGHEEAHKAGFTHLEHGNTIKGNEQSVPYLVNAAFDTCPNGDSKE